MKYLFVLLAILMIVACDTPAFDADHRQIVAKDYVRRQMRRNKSLTITGFKEDTVTAVQQPLLERPIRYAIMFTFKDSTGALLAKTAQVLFAPDGHSVIDATIVDTP